MDNIKNLNDFYTESNNIIITFNNFIEKHSLQTQVCVDHFCYKCGNSEMFEKIRNILETESNFIYQSIISKRRIAIIKLKREVETSAGFLKYLELSDQKPDNSQVNSFDHVEIFPKGISYEELVEKLTKEGENVIETKRPHHITHDMEISDQFSIKLTHQPLIEKIKEEEML